MDPKHATQYRETNITKNFDCYTKKGPTYMCSHTNRIREISCGGICELTEIEDMSQSSLQYTLSLVQEGKTTSSRPSDKVQVVDMGPRQSSGTPCKSCPSQETRGSLMPTFPQPEAEGTLHRLASPPAKPSITPDQGNWNSDTQLSNC